MREAEEEKQRILKELALQEKTIDPLVDQAGQAIRIIRENSTREKDKKYLPPRRILDATERKQRGKLYADDCAATIIVERLKAKYPEIKIGSFPENPDISKDESNPETEQSSSSRMKTKLKGAMDKTKKKLKSVGQTIKKFVNGFTQKARKAFEKDDKAICTDPFRYVKSLANIYNDIAAWIERRKAREEKIRLEL